MPNTGKLNKTICILSFNDVRKDVAGNEIYIQKSREIFENKEAFCINSEQHYKKTPLSLQMALMLAEHMMKRNTFKDVVVNNKDSADYIIECSLAKITGKQHLPMVVREGPVVGSLIIGSGGIGAGVGNAISAKVKSKAFVSYAITEVKIFDKNMKLLVELGSFAKDYEEELHPDADCWCSYNNVKSKLEDFYSEFIIEIENKIKGLKK